MRWDRVTLLCEDRAHLDVLRGICTRRSWRVVDEDVAPRGQGAASAYVLRRLPEHLGHLRGGYAGLGLLVAIDGDKLGPAGRLDEIARRCRAAERDPPGADDPVALLIPTWSIDTWGLLLCRGRPHPETEAVKEKAQSLFRRPHPGFTAPGAPVEDAPRTWKPADLKRLLDGFFGDQPHPEHPSLGRARAELARWS